jgi:hypothetical protein|nr:hypothetical protein [Neorhizobium tomejilense]
MGNETTYETFISVKEPIEVIAGILGAVLHDSSSSEGPVRYAEFDAHPVRFTVFAHRDNPEWSHLQSSMPYDEDRVAEFLSSLGVQESSIDVAMDDKSRPLQDVDAIREKVARRRATMRH